MTVYFLVHYEHKTNNESMDKNKLIDYLRLENFKCKAGFWGCPWYFVDIETMEYKPGRPGVGYGKVIGEHAITVEEFKTIYEIYKKYKNKKYFDMGN